MTEAQTFRAKVGYEILLPTLAIIGVCFAVPALSGAPASALLVMAAILIPTTLFVLYCFYGTVYLLHDAVLTAKCGVLFRRTVDVATIRSIQKTRNPISSPAPSMDRLEIRFGKYDFLIVSPSDKAAFISALQQINPNIKINLR